MDSTTFDRFRRIVYQRSGISLNQGKEALVSARVARRMRKLELPDHKTYLDYVLHDATGQEMVHLIDAISTNVTSFYRDPSHFEFVGRLAREWLASRRHRLRLWSAASSTGEEPYTLAMALLETLTACHGPAAGVDLRILATDISTRVLDTARRGVYSDEKTRGIPLTLRERYFDRHIEGEHIRYRVKPALREVVRFAQLNLAQPPFPMRGPFDAIFCRNVMIYFDNSVRVALLAEIVRLLKPNGYLFVGQAESLTGILAGLKVVRPSVYVKSG